MIRRGVECFRGVSVHRRTQDGAKIFRTTKHKRRYLQPPKKFKYVIDIYTLMR